MNVGIYIFPVDFTLLGISYQKSDMLIGEDIKVCHEISIGLIFLILEILIYKKGDE